MVLIKMGGMAKITSAIIAGNSPVPIIGIKINRSPKLGMIRKVCANKVQIVATRRLFEAQ